jgi:hypothetical protein
MDPAAARTQTPPSIAPGLSGPLVGEVCPPGVEAASPPRVDTSALEAMLGGPVAGDLCRLVLVAWTTDQVVVVDGDPALSVEGIGQGLRLETLDQLEARLAGVEDVEDIRSVLEANRWPITPRDPRATDPTTTTAPAPSACTTWGGVESHLRLTGDVFDAGSGEDLLGFQMYAPPELEADVRRLLEIALASPPLPEQAEILARIRARIETLCGALEDLPGHEG